MSGTIPSSLGRLTNLKYLCVLVAGSLQTCQLGTHLTSLPRYSYLWGNRHPGLIGTLPASLSSLTNLEILCEPEHLSTHSFPDSVFTCSFLQTMRLTGTIPSSFSSLTNLRLLCEPK